MFHWMDENVSLSEGWPLIDASDFARPCCRIASRALSSHPTSEIRLSLSTLARKPALPGV
jgi:hypothetical protein